MISNSFPGAIALLYVTHITVRAHILVLADATTQELASAVSAQIDGCSHADSHSVAAFLTVW